MRALYVKIIISFYSTFYREPVKRRENNMNMVFPTKSHQNSHKSILDKPKTFFFFFFLHDLVRITINSTDIGYFFCSRANQDNKDKIEELKKKKRTFHAYTLQLIFNDPKKRILWQVTNEATVIVVISLSVFKSFCILKLTFFFVSNCYFCTFLQQCFSNGQLFSAETLR